MLLHSKYMVLTFHPMARSISAEKASQKVRIALKRVETLSYMCTAAEILMNLQSSVHDITEKFQEKLPSQDGLLLTVSQTQKQALRTKKKYKSISSKLKLGYGSLPNPKTHGRKEWTPSSGIVLGFKPASCGRYEYIYTGCMLVAKIFLTCTVIIFFARPGISYASILLVQYHIYSLV